MSTPTSGDAVVALDVGGTAMKGVVLDTTTHAREARRWETRREQGPEAVVAQVLGAVDELCALAPDARAVGLVVPGVVDEGTGVAVYSENIEWRDVPFRRLVAERTGLPVGFGHDVRAGGLAERELGAAAGCDDVLFVPIGTGISGAMFVDGRLVQHPYAGEIGHVHAGFDEPCACGAVGCLEAVASGAAISRRYAARAGDAVPAEEVLRRADHEDADAVAVWDDALTRSHACSPPTSRSSRHSASSSAAASRGPANGCSGRCAPGSATCSCGSRSPRWCPLCWRTRPARSGRDCWPAARWRARPPPTYPGKKGRKHVSENENSGPLGRLTSEEVASQPSCWKTALQQGREQPAGLPAPGEQVLVLGCGTSYYLGEAYAWLREAGGHGTTDALIASEVPPRLRPLRPGGGDQPLRHHQGGAAGAREGAARHARWTAIVGELGTPVAEAASDVVDLSYADEQSVVQTRFPTSLLTMLRAHLGESADVLSGLADQAAALMRCRRLTESAPRQFVVLGSGWAAALAQEAALKCRESAGMWAEAYATGEYRHGPISVAGPGTLVWAMTPLSDQLAAPSTRPAQPSTTAATTPRSSSSPSSCTPSAGRPRPAATPTCRSTCRARS